MTIGSRPPVPAVPPVPPVPPRAVLVVGGTAILRPAVAALRRQGRPVTVLTRSRDRITGLPPGTVGVVGDLADPPALAAALAAAARPTAGLAYLPAAAGTAGLAALAVLRAAVTGPLVVVLTSAAAGGGPADVDLVGLRDQLARRLAGAGSAPGDLRLLLLGWTAAPVARWHTPAEISAAALRCLGAPAPALLGVVRPWADRPG